MPQWSVTVYPLAGTASSAVARPLHPHPQQRVSVGHQQIGSHFAARVPTGDHFGDTGQDEAGPMADYLGEMAC
jgi:hypothetical protein